MAPVRTEATCLFGLALQSKVGVLPDRPRAWPGSTKTKSAAEIRGLLNSGIPTRIIGDMLPCLNQPQEIVVADPDPELRQMLVRERDRMTERIALLKHHCHALTQYIAAIDRSIAATTGFGVPE